MEYTLHINQCRAIEWELSMGEALLFGYLTTVGTWAKHAPDGSGHFWLSSEKLRTELPLVCAHKDSARRHMRVLETKGLVHRRRIGNEAYFRVTDKGSLWRSKTVAASPDESVRTSGKSGRIGPELDPSPDESVRASPDESAHQSVLPTTSVLPEQKSGTEHGAGAPVDASADAPPTEKGKPTSGKPSGPTPAEQRAVVAAYHETLPELAPVLASRWTNSNRQKLLIARWRESAEYRHPEWWREFFEVVRENDWWMGRDDASKGWRANLEWLLKRQNFDKVLAFDAAGVSA